MSDLKWLPMATAPKDGKPIIVTYRRSDGVWMEPVVAIWREGLWAYRGDPARRPIPWTPETSDQVWMPMPAFPS